MRRLGMLAAGTILAMAAVALTTASALAAPAKIDYRDAFTTEQPGVSSGRVYHVDFTNADDPQAKPPAVQHVHAQLPPGARYDTAAVTRCAASDAELMLDGPSACPASSKVGTNKLVIDEGTAGEPRFVTEDIVFFNEANGVIILSHDPSGAYVVVHGQLSGNTLDIELPPLPGTPPDGGADKSEDVLFYSLTTSRGNYITTPRSCPASGRWTFQITYTYRTSGAKQTVETTAPCVHVVVGRPALRLAMFRRQAARAGSPATVWVHATRAASGIATVERHGRVVAHRKVVLHTGRSSVRLPALRRGSYRLRITATAPGADPASRTARLTVR